MGSVRKSPRNPNNWEARYRDVNGRQRTKTFPSRGDAKAWLSATETEIRRGNWIDPARSAVRFEIVAGHWLEASHLKRTGSVARDRSILDNHILPLLGGSKVGAVTRGDIQNMVNEWTGRLSPATTVRNYAVLRALFAYAETCDLITRSPCRSIRLPAVSPRDAQILDDEATASLTHALGSSASMLYLAILGLRWGEIAGLRVGDLNFLRGTITVTRQRTRGEKGRMVDQEPKTRAGRRTLSVPESIMSMIAEYLAARGVTGQDPDASVFVSPDGAQLHYSNWRRDVWLPARKVAGLGELTFHDLKHTAATLLVEEGVDVKTAQVRLGHANPQTTLRIYAQVTEQTDRAAAQKLGERLRPKRSRTDISGADSSS
jgi:integrase